MEQEAKRVWIAMLYEMNSARALLDHADSILSGYRFADESLDPLLTVASIGCEKVLKMTVGVIRTETDGSWPSKKTMRDDYGHDVVRLDQLCRQLLRDRISLAVAPGYVESLLDGIDADPLVGPFLELLSRYAANGRFYYLDDLADDPQELPPPNTLWLELEVEIHRLDPGVLQMLDGAAGGADAAVARYIEHVRACLTRWRELYYRAWIQGVCGEAAKPHGWALQPPRTRE